MLRQMMCTCTSSELCRRLQSYNSVRSANIYKKIFENINPHKVHICIYEEMLLIITT